MLLGMFYLFCCCFIPDAYVPSREDRQRERSYTVSSSQGVCDRPRLDVLPNHASRKNSICMNTDVMTFQVAHKTLSVGNPVAPTSNASNRNASPCPPETQEHRSPCRRTSCSRGENLLHDCACQLRRLFSPDPDSACATAVRRAGKWVRSPSAGRVERPERSGRKVHMLPSFRLYFPRTAAASL